MLNHAETSFAKLDAKIERKVRVTRSVVALPQEPLVTEAKARRIAGLEAISRLPVGHSTEIRFILSSCEGLPQILIGRTDSIHGPVKTPERADEDARDFDAWLVFMWPDVIFAAQADRPPRLTSELVVRPIADSSLQRRPIKSHPSLAHHNGPAEPLLEQLTKREFNVASALDANSDASRPGIPISFRPPFRFEAGHHSEMKPAA